MPDTDTPHHRMSEVGRPYPIILAAQAPWHCRTSLEQPGRTQRAHVADLRFRRRARNTLLPCFWPCNGAANTLLLSHPCPDCAPFAH